MSAGDGYRYLLTSVAAGDGDRSLSTPLTRYYVEKGCPPGSWVGSGLASLGEGMIAAGDTVTEAQLGLLMGHGAHPVTGEPLGVTYRAYRSVAQRISDRVGLIDPTLGEVERSTLVAQIEAEERARGERRVVAGFDYTFSVPKSVSVIWGVSDAATQELIVQAHHGAVADLLDLMERDLVKTRLGHGGAVQADVTGVVATQFDHYDSRAGDPQLHTHVVIANKVCAVEDGKWRTVDSRPMHAAVIALSEHYNAVLADRLAHVLGVDWEARERGRDRNAGWEITGVGSDLIGEFSSRATDIDAETDRRIDAYVAEHGRRPSKTTIINLRSQATLATRPAKELRSLAELTADWRQRATGLLGEDATSWARSVVGSGEPVLLRSDDIPLGVITELGATVVGVVGEKRSTWRRWNLMAEATRQTMAWRFSTTQDRETVVDLIVDAAQTASLKLTPDALETPVDFQRVDGSSRFRPQHMTLFSSQALLDAEDRLLDLSRTTTGPTVTLDTVSAVVGRPDRQGRLLGEDQAEAVTTITSSGRVIDVLVGPAGAGKTTTLACLRTAWETEHGTGSVVGLAPSATAAVVLAEDLGIGCENTARWLAEHDHLGRYFHKGQLVIVDEASLAGTFTLDRITGLAAQAGAKILLVGDWAQLQAVDAGGAFTLLVSDRTDAPELSDIHRFTNQWEKTASLALRHGRASAIDTYQAHDRISEGDRDTMVETAYRAWQADARAGLATLLVADATDTVRELNQRARHDLILTGHVAPDHEITLQDGSRASAGDQVITRRNNRTLRAGHTGWVRNGDRWTVVRTHGDGAVTVRRAGRSRGATVTLPADYAAEHADLGYAVTAHRAQGVTVDSSHVLVTPTTTRENLYVALTRGRERNQAYVATDQPDLEAHQNPTQPGDPGPDGRSILTRVLSNVGAELSAHQAIDAEADQWGNLTQLCAEYETLLAAGQRPHWEALLRACGLKDAQVAQVLAAPAFGALCATLGQAEADGHQPDTILPALADAGTMVGAEDIAAVLHQRLDAYLEPAQHARAFVSRPGKWILGLEPRPASPMPADFTQALAERETAMRQRSSDLLRRDMAAQAPWLAQLGPRPTDVQASRRWTEAALAVAGYRDRYQVEGPLPLGTPDSMRQQQDSARVHAMLARRRATPPTPGTPRRTTSISPIL